MDTKLAALAGGTLVLATALFSACDDEAVPIVLEDCPNYVPDQGAGCAVQEMVCSYVDLDGCQTFFKAVCTPGGWDVEQPQCGTGGSGGAGNPGGGGTGGGGDGGGGNGSGGGSGGTTSSGSGGQGGGDLTCDVSGGSCVDPDPCLCLGCVDDATCSASEDCVCPDCQGEAYCSNFCADDGICDPYNEGCLCADCAAHPLC